MSQVEASLVACALIDHGAYAKVAHKVRPEHFRVPRYALVWEVIASQASQGKVCDVVTVFQAIQSQNRTEEVGGLPGLNEIAATTAYIGQVERYADVVLEAHAHRALWLACNKSLEIAQGEGTLNEKLDSIQNELQALQRTQMSRAPLPLTQSVSSALKRYEALSEGILESGWSTGVRPLDEILAGGLRPGKVYGIAARPSVGKSSVARQIALSTAAKGLPTLVLSQEMPVDEVTDCFVAQLGSINAQKLITGKLENDDWSRMVEAAEQASRLPIFIDDDGGLTIAQVGGKARMVKDIKVLIVDYLQLCSSDIKGTTNDQVAEISKGLKRLSLQMNIAVVVLSQLNRAVESRQDKEPKLSDLRDSGAIEQDLDAAIMLWNAREEQDSRLVGWRVAKNRSGARGTFGMRFFPATYRWVESHESLRNDVIAEKGFG